MLESISLPGLDKVSEGFSAMGAVWDRNGEFSPQLIGKGKTRINKLNQQILALYARGMTTRDIAQVRQDKCGTEVTHTLIPKVTDAVLDEVQAWQNRHCFWKDVGAVDLAGCIEVQAHNC